MAPPSDHDDDREQAPVAAGASARARRQPSEPARSRGRRRRLRARAGGCGSPGRFGSADPVPGGRSSIRRDLIGELASGAVSLLSQSMARQDSRDRGDEVRRHLRRRHRGDQACRGADRRRPRAGQGSRRRALGPGQDHRRLVEMAREIVGPPRPPRDGHAALDRGARSPARSARWRSSSSATRRSR